MFTCAKFWRNRSRDIGFMVRKSSQKFGVIEVAFKKYHKNILHRYTSQDTLLSPLIHFWPRWRFFPFSKISYSHLLNGIPSKKNKKNCIIRVVATYEQRKQNLRCTNNANKIRKILPKKLWLLNWTPQRFGEIDALAGEYLFLFLVFIHFRRRKYFIFSKLFVKLVKAAKASPMQNFTI